MILCIHQLLKGRCHGDLVLLKKNTQPKQRRVSLGLNEPQVENCCFKVHTFSFFKNELERALIHFFKRWLILILSFGVLALAYQ